MEFLREALGDDLYTQVSEKLTGNESIKLANLAEGKFIPKDKFDAERATSKSLKEQIETFKTQIASLQGETQGVDALKSQIANIQGELTAKEQELKAQRMKYSIIDSARAHRAKDPEIVAQMIDREKIVEKDDGYVGINEQFDELVKTYAYMFDATPVKAGGYDPNGTPNVGASPNSVMNQLIRSAFKN